MSTLKFLLGLCLSIGLLAGCGSGSKNADEHGAGVKLSINGRTTSETGNLVVVKVSVGGKTVYSDQEGLYWLDGIDAPSNGVLVVTFEKDGYATTQRRIKFGTDTHYGVDVQLMRFQLTESRKFVGEQSVRLSSGDLTLDIPRDALDASQSITVNMGVADPTSEAGKAVFPGDYLAVDGPNAETSTLLESVSFSAVTLNDNAGKPIKTLAHPATMTMKLPAIYQTGGANAGTYDATDDTKNFIEWWSYDESKALWVREDADPATPEIDNARVIEQGGTLYVRGKVKHFSWWNADRPIQEHSCLCVKVVDDAARPLSGRQLRAQGVTYSSSAVPATTDNTGNACVTVKRSATLGAQRVKLFVAAGAKQFNYAAANLEEGAAINSTDIFTPMQMGSTIPTNRGMCTTLSKNIVINLSGIVQGTVTRETDHQPLAGYKVYTTFGGATQTDANGHYQLAAPLDTEFTVYAPSAPGVRATIASNGSLNATADLIMRNQQPMLIAVRRSNYDTVIPVSTSVAFSADVYEPEGEDLTYTWSIDAGQGTLTPNGGAALWTAPAEGSGETRVKLVISDGISAPVSTTFTIAWGGRLSFIVTNPNRITTSPMAGVTVVVHKQDGKSYENSVTTDNNGIADFGSFTRGRVTFTVWYPDPPKLFTFVDVPAREGIRLNLWGPPASTICETQTHISASGFDAGDRYYTAQAGVKVGSDLINSLSGAIPGDPTTAVVPLALPNCGAIQADGGISPLMVISDANLKDTRFGYALDQSPVTTADKPIEIKNFLPMLEYGWRTNLVDEMSSLSVRALRKDIIYDSLAYANSTANSLSLPVAFPADWFEFSVATNTANGFRELVRYQTPSQVSRVDGTMDFYYSALSVAMSGFDPNAGTLSWDATGTDTTVLSWSLDGSSVGLEALYWDVYLAGTARSWTFPELPNAPGIPQIDAKFDVYSAHLVGNKVALPANVWENYWLRLSAGQSLTSLLDGLDRESYREDIGGNQLYPR